MNDMSDEALAEYYQAAETWTDDRDTALRNFRRLAWIAITVLAAIAIIEAIAIAMMLPLQKVEPYTIMVDKQTGYVQALKPLERQIVAPDEALVKSFLAQYVMAREGFDIDSMRDTYRKVALWSADEARTRYISGMQASNPESPLAYLPRRALLEVQVKSISSLNADTSMVRFATIQTDPGGQPQEPRPWAAVLKYRFSGDTMSAADRLLNPLGFQVVRYRRDPEVLAEATPQTAPIGNSVRVQLPAVSGANAVTPMQSPVDQRRRPSPSAVPQ
jgi:type IV secretion system protein VirB8